MNILTITTLYPNHIQPGLGIFVEKRLIQLRKYFPDISHSVIAPVPWFPFKNKLFGYYSDYARVKKFEVIDGVKVFHPRYLVIPKIGMLLTPFTLALSILLQIRRCKNVGVEYDIVDGHYFYPDGVAIAIVAVFMRFQFTLTARGTDLCFIPRYVIPRRLIIWSARRASHCMTVCSALKQILIEFGLPDNKVSVVRNGVDLELFKMPEDKLALRDDLGIKTPMLVSVGYLKELKGQRFIIEAIRDVEDTHLYLIGDGPDKEDLKLQVKMLELEDRVHFLGRLGQEDIARYFGAADVSVLASSREGWANVLLESMACGTPVVATNVWGTPEVVASSEAGVLVDRSSLSLGEGISRLLDSDRDAVATRKYAEKFSWHEPSLQQHQIFQKILKR